MATIQLGVINDIGIIRIAPFTAVELKCLASAVNAHNSAALADAATESANAAAATALSYVGISPTGAYTNLAALQAAYSTGEDGVFVVKDTGHWYFWNGSAWEDGGEYQKDIPTTTIEELRRSDLQQMSAIKEVENTLNAININQETTNTASGYGTISLPKNAANGGMSVKMEGLTAENLVVNGDFRNGTIGWSNYAGGTSVIENGYMKYTPISTVGAISNGIKALSAGDEWYIKSVMKSDSAVNCTAGFSKSAVGTRMIPSTTIGTSDTTMSGIITIENVSIDELVFGRPSVLKTIYIKSAFAINLTATFGAGNEPTKEQCDLMFADYFEGKKNFEPTGRVRSVGKNLFRNLSQTSVFNGLTFEISNDHLKINGSTISGSAFRVKISNGMDYSTTFKESWLGERLQLIDGAPYCLSMRQISGTYSTGQNPMLRLATSIDENGGSITFPGGSISNSSQQGACLYLIIYNNTTFNNYEFSIQLEKGSISTPFEPYTESNLYLQSPELRSNGTVKDEIRKGANGYELVKRVGVGTSNGEIVTGGDFSDPTKWTVIGGTSIISNGTLKIIADAGIVSTVTQSKTITAGKIYRYKIDVLSLTGVIYFYIGNTSVRTINSDHSGKTISGFSLSSTGGSIIRFAKELGASVSAEFDNISIFEYNATEGVAIAGGEAVYGGNIHYTLATPVITPISYGGILNSAENGTVYHEPIIADAGVYGTSLSILMTDYPIDSLEEIIKYEDGAETLLDTSTAVIASGGLSFTHPDLADGDLVLFTYAFDKESTSGNITATFYDSNIVKIDTVTGTAYKIEDVVTNGILTRTLTEV